MGAWRLLRWGTEGACSTPRAAVLRTLRGGARVAWARWGHRGGESGAEACSERRRQVSNLGVPAHSATGS